MTTTIDALNNIMNGLPPVKANEAAQVSAQLLQEADAKKTEYRSRLKHGVWMVEFTKVDGSGSVMECTLDPRYLPPGDPQDTGTKAADNPTVLRVYALDRDGWRSFKVLNVTRFYQKPETL